MAFVRPTLQELITRIEGDLISRLQITSTVLRRALVRILARVFGGAVHGVHGHVEWASRQIFASTSDREYLDLHGAELAVERKAAAIASGNVTFSGTNGTVIPADTRLLRQDGVEYRTTASGTIAIGIATVAASAIAAGTQGNADAAVSLSMITPIAGITSSATIAAGGITGGIDTEGDDDYRARILARKRNPPQGGSETDYVRWATEVAGVTRAWVYPGFAGPGTVGVTFVLDDAVPIIPDAAKVAAVQAYVDDPTRRPVTAEVEVFAPVPVALNLEIELTPDTAEVRAAVQAEIEDLLLREGIPGATLLLTHIREAISTAAGETDHVLVSPAADVAHAAAEIPVLGVITWS